MADYVIPGWMLDCIAYYDKEVGRPPTTMELLMWKEAEASCRMEREQ